MEQEIRAKTSIRRNVKKKQQKTNKSMNLEKGSGKRKQR